MGFVGLDEAVVRRSVGLQKLLSVVSGGGQVGGQVFGRCCLGGEAVSGRVWGCRRSRCAVGVRVGGRHRKVVKGGGRLGGRCSVFRVSGERDRWLGLV